MTSQLDRDLVALDRADARLAERARVRQETRERRAGRRELRRRRLEYPARLAAPAVAGTVVLVALLWVSGGDLSGWPEPLAVAAVAAVFVAPAARTGRHARADGRLAAATAALTTFGIQLALTFLGAFLLLHLGPA